MSVFATIANGCIYIGLLLFSLYLIRKKRQYLGGADAVFVTGDPYNKVVVHAVLTTKTPLQFQLFKKIVAEKVASHARFRQRIVKRVWKWHYFQSDESKFDLANHIKVHKLDVPPNADEQTRQAALEKYASDIISTPINMKLPPWEFILVERYGVGSAIIFRVHHSIADGISLMRIAMTIFKKAEQESIGTSPTPELNSPGENISPKDSKSKSPSASSSPSPPPHRHFHAKQKFLKPKAKGPATWIGRIWDAAYTTVRVLLLRPDRVSLLKPKTNIHPGVGTNAKWLQTPLALSEIKQLSYATGTSVNDILFAVVAAAFRTYSLTHGVTSKDIHDITTIMWVSLQGTEVHEKIDFGNKIGALYLPLALSEPDDMKRLLDVRDRTSKLQVSPEPFAAMWLMKLVGLLPQMLTRLIWDVLAYKPSSSMSNMPGPQHPVTWGENGPEIDRMVFFVPPQGTIATFVTILSYNGAVQMGFLSDERVVPNPGDMTELFQSEYTKLRNEIEKLQNANKIQSTLGLEDKYKVAHQ